MRIVVEVEEIMDEEENESITSSELTALIWDLIYNNLYTPNLRVRVIYHDSIMLDHPQPVLEICYDKGVGLDHKSMWHMFKRPIPSSIWNVAIDNIKTSFKNRDRSSDLYLSKTISGHNRLTHIGNLYNYGE